MRAYSHKVDDIVLHWLCGSDAGKIVHDDNISIFEVVKVMAPTFWSGFLTQELWRAYCSFRGGAVQLQIDISEYFSYGA